jgi:2-polyprenyl-6-methoxyphenol hydroxylase-like FAD-dependent oxidoreductase
LLAQSVRAAQWEKHLSTTTSLGNAVVLGGSIGGILAARVLSDAFRTVTLIERDHLPSDHRVRRGVPQGDQPHAILARGLEILDDLFPGLWTDLIASGAVPLDLQRDVIWVNDGKAIPCEESDLRGLGVSRPLLEGYLRARVTALPNVTLRGRTEALGLLASPDRSRVIGARVLGDGGVEESLPADLVIDTTGRGNRGRTWLAEIGYGKPIEESVDPVQSYTTRTYRRSPGPASAVVCAPWPAHPRGAIIVPIDGDRWICTLVKCGPDLVSADDTEDFLEFARRLPTPEIHERLRTAEPVTEPVRVRLPASVRRRYERMTRLPDGFVCLGDAICSFNPAYGQGMTVAAVEATILRDCLNDRRAGLAKRFYAKAAKAIDVPWDIAVGADLRFRHVVGRRSVRVKLINAYVARFHTAAARPGPLGRTFLRVANLVAPPVALFAPSLLIRVLWSGRRRP